MAFHQGTGDDTITAGQIKPGLESKLEHQEVILVKSVTA